MTNIEVIKSFLQGEKAQTGLREIVNGYYMYKARTLTTSKIQSQLERLAHDYYRDSKTEYYTDLHTSQN